MYRMSLSNSSEASESPNNEKWFAEALVAQLRAEQQVNRFDGIEHIRISDDYLKLKINQNNSKSQHLKIKFESYYSK